MAIADILGVVRYAVAKVLGLEVGDEDDLCAAGADSVNLPEVVVVVEEHYGVQLTPDDLNTAPTIKGIAEAVAKREGRSE